MIHTAKPKHLDIPLVTPLNDPVNHPPHYTQHPSKLECIDITEHMNFCLGNCIKYIWRASLKGQQLEDLKKAQWYLTREIERITKLRQENETYKGTTT